MSKCVLAVYSIYVVSIFRLYFYFEFEIALVDCYLNVPIATIIHFNGSYSHGIRIQKCNQVCQFVSNYFQLNWKRQKASTLTFRWIYIYIYKQTCHFDLFTENWTISPEKRTILYDFRFKLSFTYDTIKLFKICDNMFVINCNSFFYRYQTKC